MSTTRMRDRIFAGFGALLFLVTASAFTIMVVIDMVKNKDTPTKTSQTSCTSTASEEILAVPESYKPDARVSELQQTDLTEGTGEPAKAGDCLQMKYYGTLASDGTMFDENYTKQSSFAFTLGAGQVIKGWDQGLVGLKAGGVRRLTIPAALAYGQQGQGSIPADADLVFTVKLLRIQK